MNNKKNTKKGNEKNSNYGITLIALVVTIIILLILAGISIGMLRGDNGILGQAGNAKKLTDIAGEKEILNISVVGAMGKSKYGDISKEMLDDELDKNVGNENYSSEAVDKGIFVTFKNSGRAYIVDSDGNVEKAAPRIVIDENSLAITNTDGSSITKGQVEQGTALKISFNASVQGGTVTISQSLPHTTTAEEIEAKEVEFTITANVPDETVEPRTYKVSLKDVYKSNVIGMEELRANASTYFGYDVINYAQTLPSNLRDTEWQLFYAGALDGETEERIYLISKGFVKNTVLPAKDGAKPIPTSGSNYKAQIGLSIYTGLLTKYSGSSDIASSMQKYNKDYFNDYTSENSNMKAVAYLLDTTTWGSFANSSEGYAEWAIGGPTVELLFTAYNKYKGLTGSTAYKADAVSADGYQISKEGGKNYANYYAQMIEDDTNTIDSPYSVSNLENQALAYWLASPSNMDMTKVMSVRYSGYILSSSNNDNSFNDTNNGFRPIVLLNSNFQLEKKTSGGKEVFQIVPKEE